MEAVMEKTEIRSAEVFENCGQKIFSVLHQPEGVALAPLLVIVHGFSSNKIGANRGWVSLAEACTKKGLAALRFDLRGCGDSEGQFKDLSLSDMVSDIVTVLECIKEYPGIDENRIALFGSSLGGALSILAAAEVKFIKALVLWAAVASGPLWLADWMKAHPNCPPSQLQETLRTYRGCSLSTDFQQEFFKMDAAKILSTLDLPFLHLQGSKDDTVTLAHQKAYQATKRADAEFVTYPELDHHLGMQSLMPEVFTKILSWLHDRI